jgi:hypothetical protein
MINNSTIIFILTIGTTAALEFLSPFRIEITRPFQEISDNCQQDIASFCSKRQVLNHHIDILANGDSNLEMMLKRDDSSESEDTDESAGDYDDFENSERPAENEYAILDYTVDTKKDEGNTRQRLARQLRQVESGKKTKTRHSLSMSVTFDSPGELEEKKGRQSRAPLHLGPDIDVCLWNAYDTKTTSKQCTATLENVQNVFNALPTRLHDEYDKIKVVRTISLTFTSAALGLMILFCVASCRDTDDEDDEYDVDDEDLINDEYHAMVGESKQGVYFAIPAQVV